MLYSPFHSVRTPFLCSTDAVLFVTVHYVAPPDLPHADTMNVNGSCAGAVVNEYFHKHFPNAIITANQTRAQGKRQWVAPWPHNLGKLDVSPLHSVTHLRFTPTPCARPHSYLWPSSRSAHSTVALCTHIPDPLNTGMWRPTRSLARILHVCNTRTLEHMHSGQVPLDDAQLAD